MMTRSHSADHEDVVQQRDAVGEDAASEATSVNSSSTPSKAKLLARIKMAKEQEQLEMEELRLKQQRRIIEMRMQLLELEDEPSDSDDKDVMVNLPHVSTGNDTSRTPVSSLDPNVGEFVPHQTTYSVHGKSDVLSMNEFVNAVRMPALQLVPFDGNPIQYNTFIRSFENTVENSTNDDASKLMRLITYCTGKARKTIEFCAGMEPTQGYRKARELLTKRYGNNYLISESWVRRLLESRPIKPYDSERLQILADDLTSFIETISTLEQGHSAELYNQHDIVKVAELLPNYLQARVKRELCKLRDDSTMPNFRHLEKLVREAAQEANDPLFGHLAVNPDRKHVSSQRTTSAATSSGSVSLHEQHRNIYNPCLSYERSKFARQHRLCFNCLSPAHLAANCLSSRRCNICGKRHAGLLHKVGATRHSDDIINSSSMTSHHEAASATISTCMTSVSSNLIGAGGSRNVLPIVPVLVRKPGCGKEIKAFALIDSGSTNSFVSSKLKNQLQLYEVNHKISLATLTSTVVQATATVSLEICNLDKSFIIELNDVIESSTINREAENRAKLNEIQEFMHLRNIEFFDADISDVELLIGQDCPDVIMPLEVRRGEPGQPFAVRTILGWTINGPVSSPQPPESWPRSVTANFIIANCNLDQFWARDAMPDNSLSREDSKVMALWKDSCRQVEGHYELPIPFKVKPDLPDNFEVAARRLNSLKLRLERNHVLHDKYTEYMSKLLDEGYCEQVNNEAEPGMTWYLPHHAVCNVNKPDKVRVVFDCSSKHLGVSLNDKVYQGPDLMNILAGVLLRFRTGPVAFMADVEAMFHQVRVPMSNRDCLRFLWWPSGNLAIEPEVFRMTVHIFGGIWSPS